jgi:hypothetical protein
MSTTTGHHQPIHRDMQDKVIRYSSLTPSAMQANFANYAESGHPIFRQAIAPGKVLRFRKTAWSTTDKLMTQLAIRPEKRVEATINFFATLRMP